MSQIITCQHCNDEFEQSYTELFCSNSCRNLFWRKKDIKLVKNINSEQSLGDIKYCIEKFKADTVSLKKSIERIEHDYSDWEDRVNTLENMIRSLEEQIGVEEKELDNLIYGKPKSELDFDALDELMNLSN